MKKSRGQSKKLDSAWKITVNVEVNYSQKFNRKIVDHLIMVEGQFMNSSLYLNIDKKVKCKKIYFLKN